MQIIIASGIVLFISVSITMLSALSLGALIGLINAAISVFYTPYKVFGIFPKGGRSENPSLAEDLKNIINERNKIE